MPAIANWLVARPQNAVLGLIASLLINAPFIGAIILTLLILQHGVRLAAMEAVIAAGISGLVFLATGASFGGYLLLLAGAWIPVALLTLLLVSSRSLTLLMQITVIIAVAGVLAFQIVVADSAAFWQPILTAMREVVVQNGLDLQMELLTADVLTISMALALWLLYCTVLLVGYWGYRQLPFETAEFGRFRDLNFGRVIAFTMAGLSLLALVIGATWLQNIAFLLFVMFMMQGLAIMHWLRGENILPIAAVIAVYVLLPILQVLLMMVLALVGYTDALFGIRRRLKKT